MKGTEPFTNQTTSLNPKQSRLLIRKESHKRNSIDSQRNRVVIFLFVHLN